MSKSSALASLVAFFPWGYTEEARALATQFAIVVSHLGMKSSTKVFLPPTLMEIAEVIGRDLALRIAEVRGGTRIYFPKRVRLDHWLVRTIGLEETAKLLKRFGGDSFSIPLGPHSNAWIGERVKALKAIGLSSRQIALTLKITQRTVHRHK